MTLTDDQKEICRQAVERFGRRHQIRKVAEELRELADELYLVSMGESSLERVVDERADVALMLYQLDELILPGVMKRVAYHLPTKILKLQRHMEAKHV